MPKVTLTTTQRTTEKVNGWILLQMKLQKKTLADLGNILNLPGKCVGERVRGITPWRFEELLDVIAYLGGRLEELL